MAEKRYAILIASSEYSEESGLSRLRCPENDVRAVDEILRSPDFGQFTETFVFRNVPSYEILPRLNSVLTEAGKDDLVLIYFSGHGKLNRLGHLCLATANTDSKALEATSILASTIKSYFDLSYSRKKILLLDCCYSGAAGEEFARTRGGVDEELQLMSGGQGTFIMTASSGLQTSVEKEGDQYGLFTKHLVQGIRSGEADKNEDGQVDMQELYEYVHEKVREEGAQEPMKWDLHVKGKLVIAQSKRTPWDQIREESRKKLYELAVLGLLPDDIVAEAMQVLATKEMTGKEQNYYSLIERLVADNIRPADFIVQWMQIRFAGMNESDKPEEEATGQQVKSESESDVGKNERGSGGSEEKRNKLIWWPQAVILFVIGAGIYSVVLDSSRESPSDSGKEIKTVAAQESLVVIDDLEVKQTPGDAGASLLIAPPKKLQQGDIIIDPTTGMEFVYIPKGCFLMGQKTEEEKKQLIVEIGQKDYDTYYKDELPRHEVCVDGVWVGKYEVTQGQWQKIMGNNPSRFKKGDEYPVEQVSWDDIQKFITVLNRETSHKYRLPREAEWEYACRSDRPGQYCGGDNVDAIAWYQGNSGKSTHPVGKKRPNAFGLYDMSGNVWEWCEDWHNRQYYTSSHKNNPRGPVAGDNRVVRGGSWGSHSRHVRSACRRHYSPDNHDDYGGFRLVLPVQQDR